MSEETKRLSADWVASKLTSIEAMLKRILHHFEAPAAPASFSSVKGKIKGREIPEPKERLIYEKDEDTGEITFKRVSEIMGEDSRG